MCKLPTVPNFVGNPKHIDIPICPWLNSVDLVIVVFDIDVVATACKWIDRWRSFQKPHALLEHKVFVKHRANWADINNVATKFIVYTFAGKNIDAFICAPAINIEFTCSGDFLCKPNTASAHDATVTIQHDVVANIFFALCNLFSIATTFASTVFIRIVLQRALTGLIACWTINWVVIEQHLHYCFLICCCFW